MASLRIPARPTGITGVRAPSPDPCRRTYGTAHSLRSSTGPCLPLRTPQQQPSAIRHGGSEILSASFAICPSDSRTICIGDDNNGITMTISREDELACGHPFFRLSKGRSTERERTCSATDNRIRMAQKRFRSLPQPCLDESPIYSSPALWPISTISLGSGSFSSKACRPG